MTPFIDDEAEAAVCLIFRCRHEKPPLNGMGALPAAKNGHHLDHPRMMAGGNRRHDDPVVGVPALEVAAILTRRLARFKGPPVDRLPFVGPFVPHGPVREPPLVAREEIGECEGDDRPGVVLLVPSRVDPQGRHDPGVSLGREPETAMAGGHVRDDALGIDRGEVRRAPWRAADHAGLEAPQGSKLPAMLGRLQNTRLERRFIGKVAVVPVELFALQL